MIYLNEDNIIELGINWDQTIGVIEKAVIAIGDNDYAQPIKPYLRYREPNNRIIAMPAFVGGETNMAGIKWIASFPGNVNKDMPRASSVIVLNNAETGQVESIINTALLSIIRTASVTGLIIKYFEKNRNLKKISIGISGFGPIGQNHFKMCNAILGDKVAKYYLYDKRPIIDPSMVYSETKADIVVANSWEEVFDNSDIFITCTVADTPYVDKKPKKGALILNISLRDFKDEAYEYFKHSLIVDDWKEVCRENTTIENWNLRYGLQKEQVKTIVDVVAKDCFKDYPQSSNIMFNPMGMAVFDIAVATYYYKKALENGKGNLLK